MADTLGQSGDQPAEELLEAESSRPSSGQVGLEGVLPGISQQVYDFPSAGLANTVVEPPGEFTSTHLTPHTIGIWPWGVVIPPGIFPPVPSAVPKSFGLSPPTSDRPPSALKPWIAPYPQWLTLCQKSGSVEASQ